MRLDQLTACIKEGGGTCDLHQARLFYQASDLVGDAGIEPVTSWCEGRFQSLYSTGQRCRVCRHSGACVRPDGLVVEVVGKLVPSVFRSFSAACDSRLRQQAGTRQCPSAPASPTWPGSVAAGVTPASYGRSVPVSLIGSGTFTLPDPTSKAITLCPLTPVSWLLGCREANGHRAAAHRSYAVHAPTDPCGATGEDARLHYRDAKLVTLIYPARSRNQQVRALNLNDGQREMTALPCSEARGNASVITVVIGSANAGR